MFLGVWYSVAWCMVKCVSLHMVQCGLMYGRVWFFVYGTMCDTCVGAYCIFFLFLLLSLRPPHKATPGGGAELAKY